MKKLISTLVVILVLCVATAFAGELKTIEFNTGAYTCGYKHVNVKEKVWVNEGPPIKIKSSTIWMGADRNSTGDMHASLIKGSTGDLIHFFGWDRYKNPSSPHQPPKDFGNDHITIGTGDSILLQYFCNMDPRGSHGHVIAVIWYILE